MEAIEITVQYMKDVEIRSVHGSIYIQHSADIFNPQELKDAKEKISSVVDKVASEIVPDKWGHGTLKTGGAVFFNAPADPSKPVSATFTTRGGSVVEVEEIPHGGVERHYCEYNVPVEGSTQNEAHISFFGSTRVKLDGVVVEGLSGSFNAPLSMCSRV